MAFGDVTQSAQIASGSGTSPTDDFLSTPTEGNLIVCWVMTGAASITSGPSGWTEGIYVNNDFGSENDICAVYFKVAGAAESTTVTCTTPSDEWAIGIMEFEGPWDATPKDISFENARVASASSYTMDTNSVATNQADEMAFAILYTRAAGSNFASWTDSFTEAFETNSANKSLAGAYKVLTATGAQSTTVTISGTTAATKGGMVTVKKDVGAGGVTIPVIAHHYRNQGIQ